MSRRLWWFLLVNNLVIIGLFVRKMILDGDLVLGYDLPWKHWDISAPSENIIVGVTPFLFSLGFIIYKVITTREDRSVSTADVLDQPDSQSKVGS